MPLGYDFKQYKFEFSSLNIDKLLQKTKRRKKIDRSRRIGKQE